MVDWANLIALGSGFSVTVSVRVVSIFVSYTATLRKAADVGVASRVELITHPAPWLTHTCVRDEDGDLPYRVQCMIGLRLA